MSDEVDPLMRYREAMELGRFRRVTCEADVPNSELLQQAGLPTAIGDWFVASEVVGRHGHDAWLLGTSPHGVVLLRGDDGSVAHLTAATDEATTINGSLNAFLTFAAVWLEAAARGFTELDRSIARLQNVDPVALEDPEGVWAVMFEEAEHGLFG